MKKISIIIYTVIALATLATSCVKVIDKFNSNTITVTFAKPGPLYLTDDKTVNPKDSIQFSYTVTCPTPMTTVTLYRNGVINDKIVPADSVKSPGKLTFSGTKKIVADSAAGQYVYQIVAKDANNIYLGSSAGITVTVTPDFYNYVGRIVQVPDTTAKANNTYVSATSGKLYSYTSAGAANSSSLDFGYYYDTVDSITVASVKVPVGPVIYSLSAAQPQLSYYDISTWTKNVTQLQIATTPTYASVISGGAIKWSANTILKTNVSSLPVYSKSTNYTATTDPRLVIGKLIWFKTASNKYGVMTINYISTGAAKAGYINVDMKVQR
jgi:hypothetical protein